MLQNLVFNFCLIAAVLGWGQLFFPRSRENQMAASDFFLCGILGFIPLSFVALGLSFLMPLNEFLSYLSWLVGWALLAWRWNRVSITALGLVILFLISFFIVVIAVDNNLLGDSLLYHIQTLLWIKSDKVVLGLANIHDRFGFNSLWHLTSALVTPEVKAPTYVDFSTSTLMILAALFLGSRALERYRERNSNWLFYLSLIFVYFVPWGKWSQFDGLGSPGTDVAAGIFSLLALVVWWEWNLSKDRRQAGILLLLIPCCVMVKLSQVGLIVIWLHVFFQLFRESQKIKIWLPIIAGISVFCGLWCLRSFLLSGCFIFPQVSTCLAVPWALPPIEVIDIKQWIQSWARNPGLQPSEVLGNWQWLGPWSQRMLSLMPIRLTLLIIGFGGVVNLLWRPIWSNRDKILLAFCSCSLLGSLWTAPNPRFNISVLVVLAALVLAQALRVQGLRSAFRWVGALIVLLMIQDLLLISKNVLIQSTLVKIQNLSDIKAIQKQTSQFDVVYTIPENELCGFNPLPCAPLKRDRLHLDQSGYFKIFSQVLR